MSSEGVVSASSGAVTERELDSYDVCLDFARNLHRLLDESRHISETHSSRNHVIDRRWRNLDKLHCHVAGFDLDSRKEEDCELNLGVVVYIELVVVY